MNTFDTIRYGTNSFMVADDSAAAAVDGDGMIMLSLATVTAKGTTAA